MKKTLAACALVTILGPSVLAAAPPILPFDQVRSGMKGVGRTVFKGTQVETFDVEIVGTLPNIGPHQNLILGRCSGGPLAGTGVLAGMSGSPVFVDGKLIGAVAYSWGFAKEAIAGITPADEMLAAASRSETGAPRRKAGMGGGEKALARLRSPDALVASFPGELLDRFARRADSMPVSIPLSVSGLGAVGLARIAPDLARAGFVPVQGGATGKEATPAPPLEPGSAVGIKLTRGDVEIAATGTVTWVDGNRVVAFGHPLFGLGAVDLPLTAARAEALLPSLEQSQRAATPLGEVGAFRLDSSAALVGALGASPRMIPIRLQLSGRDSPAEVYSFDVAEDPLLSPLLLYYSLNGILASRERVLGSLTLRMKEGSVIKLDQMDNVEIDNLYAGPSSPAMATGITAYILYLLMNNDWAQPRVSGVNLILEYDGEPRTGTIRRVSLDRYRVRAGETVTATVVVSPFRGQDLDLTREITIPPELVPGRLQLFVGDASRLNRVEDGESGLFPRDLAQLIRLINRLRRNDRVYIVAAREDSGVILGADRLPSLPPSALSVLLRPRTQGNFATVSQRGILEEEIPTEFAVEGLARVQIEVEAR